MNNFFLKFRIWSKISLFSLLGLYALIFFFKNSGSPVSIWLFFGSQYQVPVLWLVFTSFIVGVIGTILVRTTLNTVRQIRDLRHRERTQRLEQQVASMSSKAAMLRTRPEALPVEPEKPKPEAKLP
jgi:uncharacterized integral membrane protein